MVQTVKVIIVDPLSPEAQMPSRETPVNDNKGTMSVKGKEQDVISGLADGGDGLSAQAGLGAVYAPKYEKQPPGPVDWHRHTNASAGPSNTNSAASKQVRCPTANTFNPRLAADPDVVETVGRFNNLSKNIQNARRGISKTNVEVGKLQRDLQETRRIKGVAQTRRDRLETFVENYQRQKRRLSWETLWGPKNGKVVINTMATDADHHNQLYVSEQELETWGVDVGQIPDYDTMKEAYNKKRRRRREDGDQEPLAKKKRLELVNGVFTLSVPDPKTL